MKNEILSLPVFDFPEKIGRSVRLTLQEAGRFMLFIIHTVSKIPKIFRNFHITVEQMQIIGITSLPLVIITSFFTGIVTAWQAKFLFSDIIPATYLGTAVGKAVMIELGPVLTSLVVAGRIGAAMASQLGTMNVTEQIDAMQCLSLDPFEFLYSPRFFASVMMLPIITIISGLTGIIGALLISVTVFKLDSNVFLSGVKLLFEIKDVVIMILKAFIFGGIISLSGCFYGYITVGGAEGVGKSTKASVVSASVWILILDFIVVSLFL